MAMVKPLAVGAAAWGGLAASGEVASTLGAGEHVLLFPAHVVFDAARLVATGVEDAVLAFVIAAVVASYAIVGAFFAGVGRARQMRCITTGGSCKHDATCGPHHSQGVYGIFWPLVGVVAVVQRVVMLFHRTALAPVYTTGIIAAQGGRRSDPVKVAALEAELDREQRRSIGADPEWWQ